MAMNEKEISKEIRSLKSVRTLLEEKVGSEETEAIFADGERRILEAWKKYEGVSSELEYHLKKIIPRACIYNAIKEKYPENALNIIKEATFGKAEQAARGLQKVTRLPGAKILFIRIFEFMTRKMFGEKAGFKNVFYDSEKNEFKMDITECPYCRYFAELDAPELAQYSCDCDDIVYGKLSGIDFIRTQTLAKGGSKCDFDIRLSDK